MVKLGSSQLLVCLVQRQSFWSFWGRRAAISEVDDTSPHDAVSPLQDSVLGRLTDQDSVSGHLTDQGGVLGRLNDQDGVLGRLTDQDGVLGRLNDQDGVLGRLTDQDGVLGHLINQDINVRVLAVFTEKATKVRRSYATKWHSEKMGGRRRKSGEREGERGGREGGTGVV